MVFHFSSPNGPRNWYTCSFVYLWYISFINSRQFSVNYFFYTFILSLWDYNWMYLDIYCPPHYLTFPIFYLSFCIIVIWVIISYMASISQFFFYCFWYASKSSIEFWIAIKFLIFKSYIWLFLETNLVTFENFLFLFHKMFLKYFKTIVYRTF